MLGKFEHEVLEITPQEFMRLRAYITRKNERQEQRAAKERTRALAKQQLRGM